jgi:phospholipase/carboxylesterase
MVNAGEAPPVQRIRVPSSAGPYPTLVMVHGYEGTEQVTWIFAKDAGPEWLVASPRGPFQSGAGYCWYHFDGAGHADPESFEAGRTALKAYIDILCTDYPVDRSRLVVLGFSQGASMAYDYALANPVSGVAALCGWIPGLTAKPLPDLDGLEVLIVHGTRDEVITVDIARKNRDHLAAAGAQVTYHEEAVGHKVGAVGMNVLKKWLAERLSG